MRIYQLQLSREVGLTAFYHEPLFFKLFNPIATFLYGLICRDTLVGEYNTVYKYIYYKKMRVIISTLVL